MNRAAETAVNRESPLPGTPTLTLRAPTPPVKRAGGLGASRAQGAGPAPLTPIKWDAEAAAQFGDAKPVSVGAVEGARKSPSKPKSPKGGRRDQKGKKGKHKGKKGKGKGQQKGQGKGQGGKTFRVVNPNREHVVIPGKGASTGGGSQGKKQ